MPSAGTLGENENTRETNGVDPKTPPSETSSSVSSRKNSVASFSTIPSTKDIPDLPHHELGDSDFVAWLRKNSDAELDTFASEHSDKHVQKKYQHYLQQLGKLPHGHTESSLSHCDGLAGSKSHKEPSRSEAKRILHALHLDRKDREQKKKDQARLKGELEDKLWKEELRKDHEARLAKSPSHGVIPGSFTLEPDKAE